jgi:hypothetical protein
MQDIKNPTPGEWTITIRPITRFRRNAPETRRMPPGPNSRIHPLTKSWWIRNFKNAAWQSALEAGIPRMQRARVEILNLAVQPPDRDNLYGCTKAIVDGLALRILPEKMTKSGPVPMDDEDHLDLHARSEKVKHYHQQRIIIRVTRLA